MTTYKTDRLSLHPYLMLWKKTKMIFKRKPSSPILIPRSDDAKSTATFDLQEIKYYQMELNINKQRQKKEMGNLMEDCHPSLP